MDLIERQAAIDYVEALPINGWVKEDLIQALETIPSAQPETDGFCDGCKEYDSERNFCPRFDRVIKQTVEEMKAEQRWIPVSERLPEDVEIGEEYPTVIFCDSDGKVYVGFCEYSIYRIKWWNTTDWEDVVDNVIAWMPLPEPYKERWEE